MMNDASLASRILARCVPNGGDCLVWIGSTLPKGYGQIRIKRITYQTHRAMWYAVHGPIPGGLIVMHRCDNPPCCNPDHLLIGTYADNTADMIAKGRVSRMRNERSGMAKLTNAEVAEIRSLRAKGIKCVEIALRFGVDRSHVSRVARGLRRPAE